MSRHMAVYAPETIEWLLRECEEMAAAYEADPSFDGTLTLTPASALALVRSYRALAQQAAGGADGGRPLDPVLLRYVTDAIQAGATDRDSVRKKIRQRVREERAAGLSTLDKPIGTVKGDKLDRYIRAQKVTRT